MNIVIRDRVAVMARINELRAIIRRGIEREAESGNAEAAWVLRHV